MPVKLNSSGGGSVTLDVPATATATSLIIPSNAGTMITTGSTGVVTQAMLASNVVGNGPAFSAYLGSGQSLSSNVVTKLNVDTELFDTNNNYNTSLYRFTPSVAGYYFVTGRMSVPGGNFVTPFIYKNGLVAKSGTIGGVVNSPYGSVVSGLVYLNGSTDFIELYGLQAAGSSQNVLSGADLSHFDAFLARSA
jgi:hypothetical protein